MNAKGKSGKWYFVEHPSQSNHDENGKPVRWIAYRYYDERPKTTFEDAFDNNVSGTAGWIINTVIRPPVNAQGYPTQDSKMWNDFVEPAELVGYQDQFKQLKSTIIKSNRRKWLLADKWSVGGSIDLNRNQAIREGEVIGETENEVLVEYEMPNGAIYLNQITKFGDTDIYKAVSRRNPAKKWEAAVINSL
tara:strand:+ start:134 stop:706 length:573 start_codon:yes stop_codon:yes gene_type:complete